jgi:hypothetical protein
MTKLRSSYIHREAPDSEPQFVCKDNDKGYVPGNMVVISTRAARIIEAYTHDEMLDMVTHNQPPDGYSVDEIRRVIEWMDRDGVTR